MIESKPSAALTPHEGEAISNETYLLYGYLGGRNIGDDAMLLSFLSLAPASAKYIVLARSVEDLPKKPDRDLTVIAASPKAILKSMGRCQGIVRVGGTEFHDEYKDARARKMLWKNIQYSGILFLGRLLGKKAAAFGVGAGKPERFSTKLCEKVFLKSCNIVVARDIDTYNDYRTKTKRAILGLDLAMLSDLPPVSPEAGRLGVSLVDMERYDLVDQLSFWKALIEKALEGNPSPQLHLFAFRDNDVESDLPITIQIADWGKSKGWPTTIWKYDIGIERMLEEIARCEKVLATRYHSAIFAARANVPMCIVPYNEKLLMLARDLELPSECVINLESWSSSRKISDEVFGVASLSSAFYKRQSDFRWALTAFFSLVPGRRIEVKSSGTVLP